MPFEDQIAYLWPIHVFMMSGVQTLEIGIYAILSFKKETKTWRKQVPFIQPIFKKFGSLYER